MLHHRPSLVFATCPLLSESNRTIVASHTGGENPRKRRRPLSKDRLPTTLFIIGCDPYKETILLPTSTRLFVSDVKMAIEDQNAKELPNPLPKGSFLVAKTRNTTAGRPRSRPRSSLKNSARVSSFMLLHQARTRMRIDAHQYIRPGTAARARKLKSSNAQRIITCVVQFIHEQCFLVT